MAFVVKNLSKKGADMKTLFSCAILGICLASTVNVNGVPPAFTQLHDSSFKSPTTQIFVQNTTCTGSINLVARLESGAIEYYNGTAWQELHNSGWGSSITRMHVDWSTGAPIVLVGLSLGSVEYYVNGSWTEFHDASWKAPITQMAVNWNSGDPHIVVALATGAVEYYVGGSWTELKNTDWDAPVTQMSVDWSQTNPRVVAGLGSGAVEYYVGGTWIELHNSSFVSPVTQMSVDWSHGAPNVLMGLGSGAVEHFNGTSGTWTQLHDATWGCAVEKMSVHWSNAKFPSVVLGLSNSYNASSNVGSVEYYNGNMWKQLNSTSWNAPISNLAVNWVNGSPATIVVGLGLQWSTGQKWITGAPLAVESPTYVAIYTSSNNTWTTTASETNPISAMGVTFCSSGWPSIVYGLGVNQANFYNFGGLGPDAYKLFWNGR